MLLQFGPFGFGNYVCHATGHRHISNGHSHCQINEHINKSRHSCVRCLPALCVCVHGCTCVCSGKKKIEKESESVCLCVSVFWKEIIGCVCVFVLLRPLHPYWLCSGSATVF